MLTSSSHQRPSVAWEVWDDISFIGKTPVFLKIGNDVIWVFLKIKFGIKHLRLNSVLKHLRLNQCSSFFPNRSTIKFGKTIGKLPKKTLRTPNPYRPWKPPKKTLRTPNPYRPLDNFFYGIEIMFYRIWIILKSSSPWHLLELLPGLQRVDMG